MSVDFLNTLGFSGDPFASTNAADEPLIGRYFVQPPFFPAVVGDPNAPKSNIVFAPRGGGKTAQKIMIEERSRNQDDFLCITYDKFPSINSKASREGSSDYHLDNITRSLLIASLLTIEERKISKEQITEHDRKLIVSLSHEMLGGISIEKFSESLSTIKSIEDKAQDLWNKYGGAISNLINAIAARFNIGKIEYEQSQKRIDESSRFKFESIVNVLTNSRYKSIYILIDRVDELTFTANDAEKAFEFLRSILIDLPLLETPGVAFKFFLWDQTKEYYQSAGGRPDRLIEYSLDWSAVELEKVLSRRLETYSDGKISRFDQLLTRDANYDVHKMIAHFAHGSPRDLIRICKKIVDEHTRTGAFGAKIPFRTVKTGIIAFSVERARELYGTQVAELKKVHELNFTISVLASEVFRISGQAARAKAQKWQNSGAVIKIGEVPNPGNRPQYLYGIVDPRLAVAVMSDSSIEEALEEYLLLCPHCQNLRIAYEGEITCPDCQGNFKAEEAMTLGVYCGLA